MSVRMSNGAGAGVAGAVTQALALRAGLPPLSAARAGSDVAAAVRDGGEAISITYAGTDNRLVVVFSASDAELDRLSDGLADHAPGRSARALELRFERPSLRPVP